MDNYTNNMSRRQIRHTLDSLLEGIQVIDFDWHYLYVNTAMAQHYNGDKQSFSEVTMMDKYPGIEETEVFEVLQDCMTSRKSERLEIEFIYLDHSARWFDLSIVPVEEGICIMSMDITAHKTDQEKLRKVNRLYAFISQVNQNIVRIGSQETLFHNACHIAGIYGNFKIAWIGLFDHSRKTISLADQYGIPEEDIAVFVNIPYRINDAQDTVLSTDSYFICNDLEGVSSMQDWDIFVKEHDIESCLVLPIRKGGTIIGTFNLYSTSPNFYDDQEISLLMEVTGDISFALDSFQKAKNHSIAEQQIVKNEKRFRALIEKSPDIKALSTKEGKVIYASRSIKKVLGYSPTEFVLLPFFGIFHPNDISTLIKIRERLLFSPGKSISSQLRLLHKNGHWVWCEGTITNMLHEEGIEALVSNFSDISEKKAAARLREFDRNNMNALINNTNDLMWSVDTDFNLITSNQPFDDMFRLASGKDIVKGSNFLRFEGFPQEQLNRYKAFYERAFAGETFTVTEHAPAPAETWSEISFYPIRKEKEIIGTACYSHDITRRKLSALKLERQNKELTKTNMELDRFVYSVSHDLRAPLTSMLGLISFIEEDSLEEDTLEHIKMVKTSIGRLDGSIKNILNYSRNNRTGLEIKKIRLTKTVNEIIDTLRSTKNAQGIIFDVSILETEDFYSDLPRFNTILENLISNAIKYHSKVTSGRFIKVTGETDKKSLRLAIADNGIGIAAENHEKIFDMFYRISGNTPGSGIGLYIVKETIEKLLGNIEVTSGKDAGTTFTITLKNLTP